MDVTLKAVGFRGGTPYQTTLNLTQRSDGTWHATNFGDAMQSAYRAGKGTQARSRDTYEAEEAVRAGLSDEELAELAGKYDPSSMTQGQYDAFLDELVGKGALSRFDAMRLGYRGCRILDIDLGAFAAGGGGVGTAYVHDDRLKRTLEEAEGDLLSWLESMLSAPDQGTGEEGRRKQEAVNALSDIVRRMRAA